MMGDLPEARLTLYTSPFTYIGIDYFGPMMVTVGRNSEKRWGMLVTCLTTRAITIEVVRTLSTDSCILGLRKVMVKRGTPAEIYTDNVTNFRGASVELQRVVDKIDRNAMAREFNSAETTWMFIPPASPHTGGSWERLVRSVKTSMAQIVMPRNPNDEQLSSQMSEVENVVNSKPLTYITMEDGSVQALTPNHFLFGSSNGMRELGEFTDEDAILRKNYMRSQQFANVFWRRWVAEYLPTLTRRTKWHEPIKPVEVGDLVLVIHPNLPRNSWP